MRIRKIHDLQDLRAPEPAETHCLHHSLRSRLRVLRLVRVRQSANLARSAGPSTATGTCPHTSVQALENDIREWIATWNDNPRPFTWTKTADEILSSLADYLDKVGRAAPRQRQHNQQNFRRGTLDRAGGLPGWAGGPQASS